MVRSQRREGSSGRSKSHKGDHCHAPTKMNEIIDVGRFTSKSLVDHAPICPNGGEPPCPLLYVPYQAHVENGDNEPIMVFPEGTCVNNEYCIMFKKGCFDLGADVYPVSAQSTKLCISFVVLTYTRVE